MEEEKYIKRKKVLYFIGSRDYPIQIAYNAEKVSVTHDK